MAKYYYDTGESKVGPVTGNELVRLRAAGEIAPDTWVRRADSQTWRPLSQTDLREEEEQEANPSLWRFFLRHVSLGNIILLAALLIVALAFIIGIISYAYPVVIGIIILLLLVRLLRS